MTGWLHQWTKTVGNFHGSWLSQEVLPDKSMIKSSLRPVLILQRKIFFCNKSNFPIGQKCFKMFLDWLRDDWFMVGPQIGFRKNKQTKKSTHSSEGANMTEGWTRGGSNQVQGRKKRQTHWRIQIIFTQRTVYITAFAYTLRSRSKSCTQFVKAWSGERNTVFSSTKKFRSLDFKGYVIAKIIFRLLNDFST